MDSVNLHHYWSLPLKAQAHVRAVADRVEEPSMHMFYTVRCDKVGYPVQYIDPETLRVKWFGGSWLMGEFGDPAEASQEFKACVGGEQSCYLEPAQFQGKVRLCAQHRREKKNGVHVSR